MDCNGSPKTGTHLLQKAVKLFGGYATFATHNHNPSLASRHIHIIRNPRDALISYLRMNNVELLRSNIIKEMPRFIEEYSEYIPLLSRSDVLTVTFENLLTDESEIGKISQFLNLPLTDDHFRKLWGETYTFTGRLSDWKSHFTHPKTTRKWKEFGGLDLEKELGYDCETDKRRVRKV